MAPNPLTQVLLRIDSALQEELITDSGVKLYIDPTYRKEWQSSVTGIIEALPTKVHPKHKRILDQLAVGDEICMSYQVVADFEFKSDREQFMLTTEENEYVKEFVNGKGEWIKMYALPARKGIKKAIWVGVYLNKRRDLIDGVQGEEEEVFRWMGQFSFGKTDIYTFNNFFEFQNKSYWKCDLEQIFAKRVKGHLVAVGDRVICKPIEDEVPEEMKAQIQHALTVKFRYQDRGRVLTGGKEMGIKKDSIVHFNPRHCEKYEFYGKSYFLINQKMVTGTWQ